MKVGESKQGLAYQFVTILRSLEGGPGFKGILLLACLRCVDLVAKNNAQGWLEPLSLEKLQAQGRTRHRDLPG